MAWLVRGHKASRSTPEPRVSDLSGRHGAVRPGGPLHQRDRAVSTDEAKGRFTARASVPETGPALLRRTPTSSEGVRPSVVTSTKRRMPDRRTYVLDTSVLLADPNAMARFDEHEVVLPIVVVTELEAKRHHPELGYFARQALRLLDDFRVRYGRLDAPIPLGDLGGTLRVELNHSDPGVLPAGYRLGDNDSRILAVARNLQAEGFDVTVVSKDLPLRIKASSVGLLAEEYRAELAITSGWTGMEELLVSAEDVDTLFAQESVDLPEAVGLPVHTGLVLQSERGKALGRVTADGRVKLVRGDREAFGIHGRSAEQRIAL